MIALLLAAAAAPMTPVDAERAFAADAQKLGQWTAFRKWSTEDATMFTPQPVNAHEFLKGRADPAASVFWWPTKSFVSCDGTLAINYGPWVRNGGSSVGYFTTVWRKESASWRWEMDHGDALKEISASAGEPALRKASCTGTPPPDDGDPPRPGNGKSFSVDGTLAYQWSVASDGAREFRAYLFNGTNYELVLDQKIAAAE